jgi:GNAT superfamily N-acetyltransferase
MKKPTEHLGKKVKTKELTPDLWPALESLFGSKGACGGCWCQAWRIAEGERWHDIKGAIAKERLCQGVLSGAVHGVLAFIDEKPVGWCSFGPRDLFPRLNRARSLKCNDSSSVWAIPCFFVSRDYRGTGIATALLDRALRVMKRRNVEIAEGYPSKPDKTGRYISSFAWTGTQSLFRKAGFTVVGNPGGSKQRVRKQLRADLPAATRVDCG